MKGIVYTKYGSLDVLQLKEVAKPVPADDQVLVKVHAASANALDFRRFEEQSTVGRFMDGVLLKAIGKVLGADIAGQVEAVGSKVKKFKPGDEVYGLSAGNLGGFAEYTCAAENSLALKPANVSFEQAAAIPVAALTALQGLRDKGHIQSGQKVLIHGASGGVGTFAVQIAKFFGANVTAVCRARNVDMVRAIGADHVIDYTKEDFTQNGQRYNLIVAVNGNRSLGDYRRALNPSGIYVAIGGSLAQVFQALMVAPFVSMFSGKKMGFMGIAKITHEDLVVMSGLIETGKVLPVIDRCYSLGETAEAIRYLVEEHARGKVVITID